MRKVSSWDETFMNLALSIAADRSKDPNTQCGCVIVDRNNDPVAFGYNGFGPGSEETDELWERPIKYDHVIHAETNAIGRAARRGCSTEGATAYITHLPCLTCAKVLIAAGIKTVVCGGPIHGWDEDHDKAKKEFVRCGVRLWVEGAEVP